MAAVWHNGNGDAHINARPKLQDVRDSTKLIRAEHTHIYTANGSTNITDMNLFYLSIYFN